MVKSNTRLAIQPLSAPLLPPSAGEAKAGYVARPKRVSACRTIAGASIL